MRHLLTLISVLCLLIITHPAQAQNHLDMGIFEVLPIQHEGRIKPLSGFARTSLHQISGKNRIENMNAGQWLAATIFDPQTAADMPVFNVTDKALIQKLELKTGQKLYSYNELQPALQKIRAEAMPLFSKDEKQLTGQEKALLRLYENTALITALLRSFTALLPLDIILPAAYQKSITGPLNFTELLKIEKQLETDLAQIIADKGRDPAKYSAEELAIAKTSFHLNTLRAGGDGNDLLRIIPVQWESSKENWASPWTIVLQGQGSPATGFLLSQWSDLADAYRQNDKERWAAITVDILTETQAQSPEQVNTTRLKIERAYRALHLYGWVITLYLLGAVFAAFIVMRSAAPLPPAVQFIPFILTLAGLALHAIAIAARIYILARPPVGTLYESILFVALIIAGLGAAMSRARPGPALIIAGLTASAILFCAPVFGGEKDNLEVLSAVLNTNFWLTTHVLCITAGYGVCILAAGLAHTALYVHGFKNNVALWEKLQKTAYRLSIAALLLTAIGTTLGGIWADQSWGRFWGWDPKENGALLIVLWLIWAQHGRIAKKLNPPSFMAMIAALNIIVALSWFGVNLLNVGLHSYGFTSGLLSGLIIFCCAETILTTILYTAAKKAEKAP